MCRTCPNSVPRSPAIHRTCGRVRFSSSLKIRQDQARRGKCRQACCGDAFSDRCRVSAMDAATRDGKITAIGHESWSGDLPGGELEAAASQTRLLYAGANRMTAMRLAVLNLPEGNSMRAPGEAPGLMALEIAMGISDCVGASASSAGFFWNVCAISTNTLR